MTYPIVVGRGCGDRAAVGIPGSRHRSSSMRRPRCGTGSLGPSSRGQLESLGRGLRATATPSTRSRDRAVRAACPRGTRTGRAARPRRGPCRSPRPMHARARANSSGVHPPVRPGGGTSSAGGTGRSSRCRTRRRGGRGSPRAPRRAVRPCPRMQVRLGDLRRRGRAWRSASTSSERSVSRTPAGSSVEAADGLQVVREHVGPGGDHRRDVALAAREVGGEHLDAAVRDRRPDRADPGRPDARRRRRSRSSRGDAGHAPRSAGPWSERRPRRGRVRPRRRRTAWPSSRRRTRTGACTGRRGSGTSPRAPPSTRRCSGSRPPRSTVWRTRAHDALEVGVVRPIRALTFNHSGRRPRAGPSARTRPSARRGPRPAGAAAPTGTMGRWQPPSRRGCGSARPLCGPVYAGTRRPRRPGGRRGPASGDARSRRGSPTGRRSIQVAARRVPSWRMPFFPSSAVRTRVERSSPSLPARCRGPSVPNANATAWRDGLGRVAAPPPRSVDPVARASRSPTRRG